MSSKLARQSLDLLQKDKKKNAEVVLEKRKRVILPATKKGIKKVKYEIRYGQHQQVKLQRAEALKRENPIDTMTKEKHAQDEKLARNVKRLTTKLKATETERQLWKKIMRSSRGKGTEDGDEDEE